MQEPSFVAVVVLSVAMLTAVTEELRTREGIRIEEAGAIANNAGRYTGLKQTR
jgi:hypothetical protein